MNARTIARSRPWLLAALIGILWSCSLFATLAWKVPPGPETGRQWAILTTICAQLAIAHAGLLATVLGLASLAQNPRRAVWACVAAAAALTVIYGTLTLSLVKFVATHAHLRTQDLWFILRSAAQVAGEGTREERGTLGVTLFVPIALAVLFFRLTRAVRSSPVPPRFVHRAMAVTAAGIAALALLSRTVPSAGWALATLVPETALLARWLDGAATAPPSPADPRIQARIGAPSPLVAAPRPWSVVVVMLESVPWKRVFGPERRAGSTPVLDRLAAESISFERAYATSTHSDYAQTSILASLSQRKSDEHDYFSEIPYPRALPWDVLGPHGWRGAVFSTQNERWGNMISFLGTPSLELLRHSPDFPQAPRRGAGAETKIFEDTIVAAFLDWAGDEPERPFVAYLNFQATHYPYVWPESFEPPFGPAPIDFPTTFLAYPREKIPRMLNRFHNALAFVDAATGELMEGLAARGLLEHTALVVVADHGEAFYEHGLPTHGTTLHEEQVRVPLLIRLPSQRAQVIPEPVSVLDAMPTLYRTMGLPRHGNLQGRDDVLEPSYSGDDRPIAFTIQGLTHEDGVLLRDWKWIVNHDRRESALFDLVRDPGERRNLLRAEPARRAALEGVLATVLERQLGYYRMRGWEQGWYPPRMP